jgi:hypothetical protein
MDRPTLERGAVKSLMSLMQVVLIDMGTLCSVDTTRDLTTVAGRYEHEGDAFFGITLADFGKAFERSLELGQIDNAAFSSFKKARGLPAFLQGFLCLVFDRDTGRILVDPCADAVYAVRQITLMWAKMAAACTDDRNRKAILSYHECETDVQSFTKQYRYNVTARSSFRRMAGLLFGDLFRILDEDVQDGRLMPRHGPGKTADNRIGNQKWEPTTWHSRIEKVFSHVDQLVTRPGLWETLGHVDIREPGREQPVKVTLVPKTMKTPRIIAMEPTHVMYVQQSIQRRWYEIVDSGKVISSMFHGFGDGHQERNRALAQAGSADGTLATLDLSEASDRVSIVLAADLLHKFPSLKEAVFATRSTSARTPKGDVRLWKFASMGSALCFPVEAAVFLTVIFLAIQSELKRPLSHVDLRRLRGKVRVYGDDIVVPVEFATSVAEHLEAFGFKVNRSKSFWSGYFRESCGGDYFCGHDVSIVKLRGAVPSNRQDVREIIRFVAFRNLMYKSGNWATARHCDRKLGRILRHFPAVADTSPALGRSSYLGYDTEWVDEHLHSPRVRAWMVRAPLPEIPVDGYPALSKVFFTDAAEPLSEDHLVRSGRPKTVAISLRGTQPF